MQRQHINCLWIVLLTVCMSCSYHSYQTYANGYIFDQHQEVIGHYSNGYIMNQQNEIIGTYRHGYILDRNDSVVGTYHNGFLQMKK